MSTPHLFYQQDFINYSGRCEDTGDLFTEVIAQFLCERLHEYCDGIPRIRRSSSYAMDSHDGVYNPSSNREEELTAMDIFNASKDGMVYDHIGKVIDYQTPLKNKRSDAAGKVDLLAFDGRVLRILELKRPDNEETMLRCVLEGFTYLQTVDHEKLASDFGFLPDTPVIACPFVFRYKSQWTEMQEDRPHLKQLMSLLNSKPYYISKTDLGHYKITEV